MIHKTAIIDPKAKIAKDVIIGAYSIIGPDVEIGSNTIIQPHVNIIGDTLPAYKSHYDNLKEKVSKYNLEKNIRFLGFKPSVKEYLEKSNFLIHSPICPDPLPTVIFEAVESNTPVIFTNLGGSYEILDSGKNGLAIDHLSIKKSAEIILKFIDNSFEQEINIKKAKSFVEKNFQMSSFNDSLKTLISKIV